VASATLPLASTGLFAQEAYPSRDIHAICMFPPGTGADIFVRFYGTKLQAAAGKTVVVENRVGAFGNIATEYVARSRPDGYTVFIAPGSSVLAAAPSLFKKLNFDPINDFEHVTTLAKIPFILLVSGKGPYNNVADLVKVLKEKGDKASYGSASNTGVASSELFKSSFGLKTIEVKYKDAGALVNDLVGGNLDFAHLDPTGSAGFIKQGMVRAIATSSKERFVSLPDIPSAAEVGAKDSDVVAWWSVHVAKGTPKPVLDKLEEWFNKIAVDDDVKKFLAAGGADQFPGNSTMLKELLVKDTKAWAEYVRIAHIEAI
jgi:tripartite-type tricarboxylate transporter receptor subunit TctC